MKKLPLDSRIEKSAKILESYLSDAKSVLFNVLTSLGVDDTEVGLSLLDDGHITFEDFHDAFCKTWGGGSIPIARIKLAWSMLLDVKKPESQTDSLERLIRANRSVQQWSNLELLQNYGKEGSISTQEELSRRSKGRFVIIFEEDGNTVDIEASLNMLKKAQFQETPQIYKLRSGEMREVYRVGEFPMQMFYECPIHKDILLLDGYCEECGCHWEEDDQRRNQFFRFLGENENVDLRLYRDKSYSEISGMFPKAHLRFKNLEEEGSLPSLKRRISSPKQGDPFRVIGSHRVY